MDKKPESKSTHLQALIHRRDEVLAVLYAVDPNNDLHLYAVDGIQKLVSLSNDGGETWTEDVNLTNLITANGTAMTDSIGGSQVHAIAFDPSNSAHILVGTDAAGIFASVDGGRTWRSLPARGKPPRLLLSSSIIERMLSTQLPMTAACGV